MPPVSVDTLFEDSYLLVPSMARPVANSTTSFWRTFQHELDDHRSTPELPGESDIVILGAGFSGTACAYHIFDANPSPPSTLILEGRNSCSGATGRNGILQFHVD